MTYGPRSEGVTRSAGGGGRLMKVGADMTGSDVGNVLRRHHKSEMMVRSGYPIKRVPIGSQVANEASEASKPIPVFGGN